MITSPGDAFVGNTSVKGAMLTLSVVQVVNNTLDSYVHLQVCGADVTVDTIGVRLSKLAHMAQSKKGADGGEDGEEKAAAIIFVRAKRGASDAQ